MKTSITILRMAVTIFMMTFIVQASFAVVKVNPDAPKIEQASDFTPAQISTLNKAQLEQRLGRRLTLKEKIGVAIVKRQAKKNKPNRTNASDPTDGFAALSLLSALISLLVFGIPLGIVAIISAGISLARISGSGGKLKGKGMAIAGLLIGIIGISIIVAALAAMA